LILELVIQLELENRNLDEKGIFNERNRASAAFAALVLPVMIGVTLDVSEDLLMAPILIGTVWDIVVQAWNDFWDESEEVAWVTAELDIIERLVDKFAGFGGVHLEDGSGNEIDVADLNHPCAPDGGMDVIIVVDEGYYTDIGFKRTITKILKIIQDGDY
jgi:hypothetical protein